MVIVGKTMWALGVMPFQTLARGWLSFTVLTLVPIGTIAQIGWATKRWQMFDHLPFILPMPFRNPFSALATGRPNLGAFDRDDDFASFPDGGLQDPYIWKIERDPDLCSCHVFIRFCP